ncbi:TPA: MarR family transcriptional regulator, partial [Enterococcus faecium]|nr:MarR family transcriptional regulator [Enterococcus faecium]
ENNYSNAVALNGLSDEEAKQLEYLLNKVCKNVSEDWNFVKKGNKRIY